jgi:hypothetical protein
MFMLAAYVIGLIAKHHRSSMEWELFIIGKHLNAKFAEKLFQVERKIAYLIKDVAIRDEKEHFLLDPPKLESSYIMLETIGKEKTSKTIYLMLGIGQSNIKIVIKLIYH